MSKNLFIKFANTVTDPISHLYEKLPASGKIVIFLFLFLLLVFFFNSLQKGSSEYNLKNIEGFQESESDLYKTDIAVYDDFYSNIYDSLVFNNMKDDYELGAIINKTTPSQQSVILDIGCGTGHHVAKLAEKGFNVMGIDASPSMIKKARDNYPEYKFEIGNALTPTLFMFGTFTHILCLYFTIYYFKDKSLFFQNCMQWLMPGGYLVIHLVDRDNFDPILPAGNPLYIVSPQRYAKERITHTKVKFQDFSYESKFDFDGVSKDPIVFFNEKFVLKNGKTRKHQHTLYMDSTEDILTIAQQTGFIYQAQIDLMKCAYDHQYLYIFTKPE